ncbi:hypothetical protein O3M35_001855 [Rhynocoris fuscipes]|uniref:Reverse transcriptase zinc-binding domain-containing protein n=1 Tax=Rhynocoris fuscipes TaxID=488301 RepID=A0AAW1CSZ8_9HEMI
MQQKSQESWLEGPAMRQTKLFMKSRSNRFTADLLNQYRQTVRMIVGLLTGHCRLNKHMRKERGLAKDDLCRYCLEEEESAAHVLCHCDSLAGLRFRIFGKAYPQPVSLITDGALARLKTFI